jgi:hypothetical protein
MIMGGVRLSFFGVCVKNNGQLSITIWFCSLNSRWAEFGGIYDGLAFYACNWHESYG